MADLVVSGSLIITGLIACIGGAGTYIGLPPQTEANVLLMISGWGTSERGREWFNTTSSQFEGWNGTARILLG